MRGNKQDESMKSMLDMARSMKINLKENEKRSVKKFMLTEEEEKRDAIAITNDARFGQNVLQQQIDSFKQTVNPGAKFAPENADEPENNPLVYYPKTGNLVFSGSIPQLNGLKFQFSLNDTTGSPYVFVDGLCLSEDAIRTLSKLRGFYLNWRDMWYNADLTMFK